MPMLVGERVLVTEDDIKSDLVERGYGEKEGKQLLLSPEEALYMAEKKKDFEVKSEAGRKLTFEGLWKKFMKIDKEFGIKYLAYRDLKERGFCVKTGFKFGSHYRVYSRGDKPGKGHAVWLVHVVPEEYTAEFPVISRAIRLAQNVRKKMIYAVVDKEEDVTYYKFERMTP